MPSALASLIAGMIFFISSLPNIPPSPPCGLSAETPILGFKNPHDFKEEFVSFIVFRIFFLLIRRLTFFIAVCVVTSSTLIWRARFTAASIYFTVALPPERDGLPTVNLSGIFFKSIMLIFEGMGGMLRESAVFFKNFLSPIIMGILHLKISRFVNALRTISGPIPAGSPIVMATTGSLFIPFRQQPF